MIKNMKIKNFILTKGVSIVILQVIKEELLSGNFYIDDIVAEKIEEGVSVRELEKIGKERGMTVLAENGIDKALFGITSLDEIIREC